jgi:uncharacterized protein YaiE (UPF0345 family)
MTIFRIHNVSLLLVSAFLVLATAAAEEEAQYCTEEGVCFANDEAEKNYYFKGRKVDIGFGEAQQVAGEDWQKTLGVIAKTKEYVAQVQANETLVAVRKECKVRNELCSFWAAIGESNDRSLLQQTRQDWTD